jgi:hypothetical protein
MNDLEVEYLLIGGYAMGAYGHIRATSDLDLFINATDENADKMYRVCVNYGIPEKDIKKEMFLVPKMIGIGEPPLRIKILKQLGVVDFQYAFQRAIIKNVDNLILNVISLEDLILLKKSAVKDRNSSRDTEDLSFLKKLKESRNKKK